MKKNIALSIILMGILLSCVGCTTPAKPTDTVESNPVTESTVDTTEDSQQESPSTDFIYEENDGNGITIKEYTGTDDEVIVPAQIDGKSVTTIGKFAFSYVRPLYVRLPQTVVVIEEGAFLQCDKLKTIELSPNLQSIGYQAFANCTSLSDIILPDTVTYIGSEAFWGCSALTHINIPANSLQEDSWHIFRESGLESVEIAEGVEIIPNTCFAFTNLKEVVLPSSVKEIKRSAFQGCKNLQKIALNEGLTAIHTQAFSGASKLNEIIIPSTVTHVSIHSFEGCTELTKVLFEGNAPNGYAPEDYEPSPRPSVDYTVYYHEGAEGFTSPTWNGYSTEVW